jgi:hypothetical protein
MVKVVFPSRVYDFKAVPEPVDMGMCFEFSGEGRPIFECGPKGFIRFSQYMATFENIAFAGPRNNIPPLVIYGKGGEPKVWDPSGRPLKPGEPAARGLIQDAGKVIIRQCYFKGFGVCLRCQLQQGTDTTQCIISESTFFNVTQISDKLMCDSCILEKSWICPTFESDKAIIVVSWSELNVRDCLFVPQSDIPEKPLKNMRWFDNHGWGLDIRCCRFGNENVNWGNEWLGEQVSLVYNYTKYNTTWVNPDKTVELWHDPNFLTIKDNWFFGRNVPVVKFFEIPNHVTITGNTGMNGRYKILDPKIVYEKSEFNTHPPAKSVSPAVRKDGVYDTSVWCWFSPNLKMPPRDHGKFITFDISNNERALNVTAQDPDYLPEPLCHFGPKSQGLKPKH